MGIYCPLREMSSLFFGGHMLCIIKKYICGNNVFDKLWQVIFSVLGNSEKEGNN